MEYTETIFSHPSFERNRKPILGLLKTVLPPDSQILEIASGTGQHAVYFQSELPNISGHPIDPDPDCRESIITWTKYKKCKLPPPLKLDATDEKWSLPQSTIFNAIVCINMVHITPWECTLGLLRNASDVLQKRGILYLYGPFTQSRNYTSESNKIFDRDLKNRNPTWGLKDIDEIQTAAENKNLYLDKCIDMPANNFSLIFIRK